MITVIVVERASGPAMPPFLAASTALSSRLRWQMFSIAFIALLFFSAAGSTQQLNNPVSSLDVKIAASKAVALVQEVGARWHRKQSCTSCHNQILPLLALKRAREHGVPVNEDLAATMLRQSVANFRVDYAIQGWNPEMTSEEAFTLIAAHDSGVPANDTAAAFARLFARRQMPDGRWLLDDFRPPQSFSEITSTAVVLRAIQIYSSPRMKVEIAQRVVHARSWLEAQTPRETDEAVFRLWGMAWAGSDKKLVNEAAAQLLAEQKPDGGWSQLPRLASDAYATGEVLVALHEAGGVPASHPAYQKGLRFLLNSQHEDGSWLVNTRIHVVGISPPYFESGFPYGHNQFISCAATSWAAMALSLSLPLAPRPTSTPRGVMKERLEPWAQTMLFGTTQEVQQLLAGGFDPNRATEFGTTGLMMAAADPDKAKLLLAAGANPNAKAKSGFTALMVASGYKGGTEVVRLLLERGAEVEPSGPQPVFNESPASLASTAGESETLRLLLDKGANPHRKVIRFWFFPADSMLAPLLHSDPVTLQYLLPRMDKTTISIGLNLDVVGNRYADARELVSRGADINYIDPFGKTALHYAASMDFGDTRMLELLLRSGADVKLRTKDGLTALALAKKYGNTELQKALERAGAVE